MRAADEIQRVHARYRPVDERVAELLANIRRACDQLDPAGYNRSNERLVEAFIETLGRDFEGRFQEVVRGKTTSDPRAAFAGGDDGPVVSVERQRLSAWALRTTRYNYIFTVPGDSAECAVLVAHYDTWRGPGADDNTTGEEIVKQYLLADLRAERRPALTHVYFLAGSEECGLIGLLSQLLLAMGLQAANLALIQQNWPLMLIALATAPLASYRFGVSGSREYVKTLRTEELQRIRAVVSVDSVGEGRLYIPRGTFGADFLRILIPFGDYDSLTDLLEEGAHLHGIKYNNYLAGGTTDHVSFLEVNNGLWHRARELVQRVAAALWRARFTPSFRIPASALVAMLPGKASPLVFGGKIHTPNDVPDRVYPEPLRDTLLVLDYLFYRIEGGARVGRPRELDAFHYARLYRSDGEFLLAFKDAIEPNRRNVNSLYRAEVSVDGDRASARVGEMLEWGVETRLRDEVAEFCAERKRSWDRLRINELEVESPEGTRLRFVRRLGAWGRSLKTWHRSVAAAQRLVRKWFFLTFFLMAYVLAHVFGWVFEAAFFVWPAFAVWFAQRGTPVMVATVVVELALLLYLMARRIPAWIDNGYRHENRGDNLGSLRRVSAEGAEVRTGKPRAARPPVPRRA